MAIPEPGATAGRSGVDQLMMRGIAWTAVLRAASQVVSWTGTVIAARILTPGDYGLFAMAMLAVGLVRMVEDFGMDAVLVQDRSIDAHMQARLAGFVIFLGIALCALFAALARPFAAFFDEPQVALLVAVLGLWCLVDATQVIPRATLQKEMEYRLLAVAQFAQVATVQAVLVTGALMGWSVWSLVGSSLAGGLVVTVLLAWWRPYSIAWPGKLGQLARQLLQGWRMLASRFAWYAYTSADQTIVGKVLGKDALGIYQQAMALSTAVSLEITSVVTRVVPGVFSAVQESREELRRYFSLLTELLTYLTFPVLIGTAVVADLAVALVLGPQWEAAVTPLRILCLYGAYYSGQVLVGQLLVWTGRFRANMWCSIFGAVVMPLGFYVGSGWGLEGIAWAWVVGLPIANVPGFIIGFRIIGISIWTWLGLVTPALVASGAMAAAVTFVRATFLADADLAADLAVSVLTGLVTYALSLLLFWRRVRGTLELFRAIRRQRG